MKPEAALSARSYVDRLRASIVQDRLSGREIYGARKMHEFDRSIPRDEVCQRRVDEKNGAVCARFPRGSLAGAKAIRFRELGQLPLPERFMNARYHQLAFSFTYRPGAGSPGG